MSFIEKTAFEARITNNSRDNLSHVAGLYQASGAAADCSAGLLCVRGAQTPCEGFADVLNENAWYMSAAPSTVTADDVIFACDPHDWPLAQSANGANNYAVGTATLGLGVPAGRYGNFTRVDFDGQSVYRFGEGNLSASIGENTFFTIANGLLVPAAAAPEAAGSVYFELRGTGSFTEGTTAAFTWYDVVARKVSVAAGD